MMKKFRAISLLLGAVAIFGGMAVISVNWASKREVSATAGDLADLVFLEHANADSRSLQYEGCLAVYDEFATCVNQWCPETSCDAPSVGYSCSSIKDAYCSVEGEYRLLEVLPQVQ